MNFSSYLSIVIVWLMFGCGEAKVKTSSNIRLERNGVNLVVAGEKNFYLDSLSAPNINALSVFSYRGQNYFSFLNKDVNRIYVYNLDHENIEYYISFDREGPDGVGSIEGYYIFSPDSILLLDNWTNTLSMIDKTGSLLVKYIISENSHLNNPLLPVPKLGTTNPVYNFNGKYYFTGYSIGEFFNETKSNRPVIMSFDKESKNVSYDFSYPDIYQDVSWGGTSFRTIYSDINPKIKNLIISFPADHNLWFYDLKNGKAISKYAGSQNFGDITSLDKIKNFMERQTLAEFFGKNPSYSSVIYDQYRDVYYRIADHPIQNYDANHRETKVKKFSIIILNNKMEKIGESLVPHLSHSRLSYFISEEGLNLQKYHDNEDVLTYSTFILNYE